MSISASAIPVSVVVVSRDRPDALYRCVLGLSQLQYNPFEVIVVADAKGLARLDCFDDKIKTVLFEEANISVARNLGVAHAAGEVIAYIDDDAVPEPTWLSFLTALFARDDVAMVGGFVLGRNGISFQWKARVLDSEGHATDIEVDEVHPAALLPPKGQAVKTEGTNMAIRRDVLVAVGGFDPAYHFYLDETDLNIRLARGGYVTAIAPLAHVHHGFAKSISRRADRVPSDLFDIGASWAVFQRKFIAQNVWNAHWDGIIKLERKRLISHMISGGLEPRSVRSLIRSLRKGYDAGKTREITALQIANHSTRPFLPFPAIKRKSVFLETRPIRASHAREEACKRIRQDQIVTLLIMSPTSLFHHVQFHKDGYWEQSGGLFGKSDRNQKVFKIWTRKRRKAFEAKRIGATRSLGRHE
jgi:GT2 family glycosyltransferase